MQVLKGIDKIKAIFLDISDQYRLHSRSHKAKNV